MGVSLGQKQIRNCQDAGEGDIVPANFKGESGDRSLLEHELEKRNTAAKPKAGQVMSRVIQLDSVKSR